MISAIGIYEARNRFSELLDRVQSGETIAITRHGQEVALLTPAHAQHHSARQAIDRLRALRRGSKLGGLRVRDLRDEGRP